MISAITDEYEDALSSGLDASIDLDVMRYKHEAPHRLKHQHHDQIRVNLTRSGDMIMRDIWMSAKT